jgi:hypothetical protein
MTTSTDPTSDTEDTSSVWEFGGFHPAPSVLEPRVDSVPPVAVTAGDRDRELRRLIAAADEAWDAGNAAREEADALFYDIDKQALPGRIGELYRAASDFESKDREITGLIEAWVPTTLRQTIILIDRLRRQAIDFEIGAEEFDPILAGLRALASDDEPPHSSGRARRQADDEAEAIVAAGPAARETLAGAGEPSGRKTLAELIVAERAAWDTETAARKKADLTWFAYHDHHPDAPDPQFVPADRPELFKIAELYRQADVLTEAANAITDRVIAWTPDNLADAIRLLEYSEDMADRGQICDGLLTGLRAIASRGNTDKPAPLPEAAAVGLLREWFVAEDVANRIGLNRTDDDDPEFEAACKKANRLRERILPMLAPDLPSLAVKAWFLLYDAHPDARGGIDLKNQDFVTRAELSLGWDLKRILPDFAPLIAFVDRDAR